MGAVDPQDDGHIGQLWDVVPQVPVKDPAYLDYWRCWLETSSLLQWTPRTMGTEVRTIIDKVDETARCLRKRSHVQLMEVRALHLRPSVFLQLVPFLQKQVPEDLANSDYPKKRRLDWKDNRVSDPLYR